MSHLSTPLFHSLWILHLNKFKYSLILQLQYAFITRVLPVQYLISHQLPMSFLGLSFPFHSRCFSFFESQNEFIYVCEHIWCMLHKSLPPCFHFSTFDVLWHSVHMKLRLLSGFLKSTKSKPQTNLVWCLASNCIITWLFTIFSCLACVPSVPFS